MLPKLAIAAAVLIWATAARAVDGQQVYDQKCKVCHSIAGVAGPMAKVGGPLDGVGSQRDAAWLKAYFADPQSKIPGGKMPKMNLTPDEWKAVTDYMLSLKAGTK